MNAIDFSSAPPEATAYERFGPTGSFPPIAFWLSTHPWFPSNALALAPDFDVPPGIYQRADSVASCKDCLESLKPGLVPMPDLKPVAWRLLPAPYECARVVMAHGRVLMLAAGQPPAYLNDDGTIEVVIPAKDSP